MDNIKSLTGLLNTINSVVIVTHQNPDGDALGSVAALSNALRKTGKLVYNLLPIPPFSKFDFLQIDRMENVPESFDAVFFLDCETPDRIGNSDLLSQLFAKKVPVVNIDHHITNTSFGSVNLHRVASSTCEILFDIFQELNYPISKLTAVSLLTGIIEDTGNFRFPSTTAHSLQVASILMEIGADIISINRFLRKSFGFDDFSVWARTFSSVEVSHDGRALVAKLFLSDFPNDVIGIASSSDLLNILLRLRSAEIVILLREMPDNTVGISFRSEDEIDSAAIAKQLGGGGHIRAAGARVSGTIPEAEKKLRQVMKELYSIDLSSKGE
jgi:phosphoesterase RecJ-like protein